MEEIRLTLINAATAPHTPRITKVRNLMKAGFKPFNREELSLIPTDCVYNPKVVNFNTNQTKIMHATAIRNGVGIGIPQILIQCERELQGERPGLPVKRRRPHVAVHDRAFHDEGSECYRLSIDLERHQILPRPGQQVTAFYGIETAFNEGIAG